MEVRKSRTPLGCAATLLAVAAVLAVAIASRPLEAVGLITLAAFAAAGLAFLWYGLRPFRLAIDADGLTMRRNGLNRHLPWSEIEKVVLVVGQPGTTRRLLLVPAPGVDLGVPLTERSPGDDRASLRLLDFDDVRTKPDEVVQALAAFGGSRFVDMRQEIAGSFAVEFPVVLRGYDREQVDRLITAGRNALVSGEPGKRIAARLAIENASLPPALRGYDMAKVDEVLRQLAAELAVLPGDQQRPQ